jgi:hypothetical protein
VYISLITALVTLLITYQSQLLFLDDDNEVVEEWSRERRKVETSFAKTGKHNSGEDMYIIYIYIYIYIYNMEGESLQSLQVRMCY